MKKKTAMIALACFIAAGAVYVKRSAIGNIMSVAGYASAFALLLGPLCSRMEKRGWSAQLSAGFSVAALLFSISTLVFSFFPYMISHSAELIRRCTPVLISAFQEAGGWLQEKGIAYFELSDMGEFFGKAMPGITASLARSGVTFASQMARMIFALVLSYYILCDRMKILNTLLIFLPVSWRQPLIAAARGCRNEVMCYMAGVLKTSIFIGLCTYSALLVLGVRDALLLALFMALFEILPYAGPVLASVPILISALEQGINHALIALVFLVLIQQIEGNFISPYFTASSTSIHPLTALISVYIFGSLMGLCGILLAVPLVVAARSAFWSARRMMILLKA